MEDKSECQSVQLREPPMLQPPRLSPPRRAGTGERRLIAVVMAAFVGTLVWTPWKYRFGTISGIEMAPIWSEPTYSTLYVPALLAEWAVICVLFFGARALLRK